MADDPKTIVLAEITGIHGVKGLVKARNFADSTEALVNYGPVVVSTTGASVRVVSSQPHKAGLLLRLQGVDSRESAEPLVGAQLTVLRDMLPDVSDDEFYFADLIGLSVRHEGKIVGEVVDVANFGAGDLIDIRFDGRKETQYLAFNDATVPIVDLDAGYLEIDPPDWLMET